MKIKITTATQSTLNSLGNKTKIKSGYKIYAALYVRNSRKNKDGYFDCPSTYLRAINSRYSTIIRALIEAGIIEFLQTKKIDPNDIFKTIPSKTYSSDMGYCMKYRFLVDVSIGEEIEVDMASGRQRRWYDVLSNSLKEMGYEPQITRDSFGRRVHYPQIKNYKTEFLNKGLCIIDAKTSHPRLLWLLMKEKNIIDVNYHQIFNCELDLYKQLAKRFNLADRKAGRDLFSHWVNGNGFVPNSGIQKLFPVASSFILGLKKMHYKDSSALLQRKEAAIFIDDLLENIPVDFALPVHDSLIIKESDCDQVLAYCQQKYPELRFKRKEIGE